MAEINLSVEKLSLFLEEIQSIPMRFDMVYEELTEWNKQAEILYSKAEYDLNQVIAKRQRVYDKRVGEYTKMLELLSSISSPDYSALVPLERAMNTARSALEEANCERKKLEQGREIYEQNCQYSQQEVENCMEEYQTGTNEIVELLSSFLETVSDAEKVIQAIDVSDATVRTSSLGIQTVPSGFGVSSPGGTAVGAGRSVAGHYAPRGENKSCYKNAIQHSMVVGLEVTEQSWHSFGDFSTFNTPEETGNRLDFNQGKLNGYLGTCGCVSCVNVLKLSGVSISEEQLVSFAATHTSEAGDLLCYYDVNDPYASGGTSAYSRKDILAAYGVSSSLVKPTVKNIFESVSAGKGVIASVHSDLLYYGRVTDSDYHAVTVTSVKTKAGVPYSVIVCDSNGMPAKEYSVSLFEKALTGKPLNVTDKIIR